MPPHKAITAASLRYGAGVGTSLRMVIILAISILPQRDIAPDGCSLIFSSGRDRADRSQYSLMLCFLPDFIDFHWLASRFLAAAAAEFHAVTEVGFSAIFSFIDMSISCLLSLSQLSGLLRWSLFYFSGVMAICAISASISLDYWGFRCCAFLVVYFNGATAINYLPFYRSVGVRFRWLHAHYQRRAYRLPGLYDDTPAEWATVVSPLMASKHHAIFTEEVDIDVISLPSQNFWWFGLRHHFERL